MQDMICNYETNKKNHNFTFTQNDAEKEKKKENYKNNMEGMN